MILSYYIEHPENWLILALIILFTLGLAWSENLEEGEEDIG